MNKKILLFGVRYPLITLRGLTGKILRRTCENFRTQSIDEYNCKILSARRAFGSEGVILHSLTFSYADGGTYEENILLTDKDYRNLLRKGKITLPFAEYKTLD